MDITPQITLHKIKHSPAVNEHIQSKIDKMAQYFHHITGCHVVVDYAAQHSQEAKQYCTRITVAVPKKTLTANHNLDTNMYHSIDTAFDDIYRQLKDYKAQL